jgi:hypothetical protein
MGGFRNPGSVGSEGPSLETRLVCALGFPLTLGLGPCRPVRGKPPAKMQAFDAQARRDYERVKRELAETIRIRNGFADPALLREAQEKDWSVADYDAKVKEKVFGKPKPGRQNYEVPMETNPTTCRTTEAWDRARYEREGLPGVIFDADRAHEKVHSSSCGKKRNPLEYAADMSFSAKFSAEEVRAYDAKIEVLKRWLARNAP